MNAVLVSLTLALSLATGQFAPQQAASEPLAPAQEARVQQLAKKLRCAVCQGLSVADSPSSMARAQLDKVRELVSDGKTDTEIVDYFVARYGEWVLLEPRAEGFNWFVWLGPVALVLGGLFVILKQRQPLPEGAAGAQATQASSPSTPAPSTDDADPYLQAVRRELER
ncbi:cytochrome c-type biogenesis protein CcmH [Corallococcus sp. AB049A]|uniref:Cytochrome c-type biogenesis protein n=2 Tax=Pseudomonadati TaxID=3379134 RepID=A0A3A8QZA9_9BACT|nr:MULTISPECIES: cytochrome c-type biogenesis protein [Corallococcus]RKH50947.1 cytochrome c-type biogenesis protein CcmH [Corallococcus sp. AB050B]RKH74106.1 cytochrome c-type biogenesis protein CcmH [Corallococcus interemptor]RKI69184.1 cytochrome c-type biogenesis protein CcmH [Corallococcus sp. AB049A]